jgi:Rrf2 family protein
VSNSRYTVALHILDVLAIGIEPPITSDMIAKSVNTNPVVIRRILATLREAGLVTSQPGVGGGITLNRAPETITLLDVYRLFKTEGDLFPLHPNEPNQLCPCGANIQAVLSPIYAEAEAALEAVLAQKTLANLTADTWQRHLAKQHNK